MKTDIIGEVEIQVDTMSKKPQNFLLIRRPPRDTTDVDERVGIEFNPTVEDWDGTDVEQ